MSQLQSTLTRDRWIALRRPVDGAPSREAMLCANARHGTLVRWSLSEACDAELRAEIPPLAGLEPWIKRARDEFDLFQGAPAEAAPPAEAADPGFVTDHLAMVREAGWSPETRSGGETVVPLGAGGGLAVFRAIAGRAGLSCAALSGLPAGAGCREAVAAYCLAASAGLRLARPCLVEGGEVLWAVPLPADPDPGFLDHALGALAAAFRATAPEIEALAAHPLLASEWMPHHEQQH